MHWFIMIVNVSQTIDKSWMGFLKIKKYSTVPQFNHFLQGGLSLEILRKWLGPLHIIRHLCPVESCPLLSVGKYRSKGLTTCPLSSAHCLPLTHISPRTFKNALLHTHPAYKIHWSPHLLSEEEFRLISHTWFDLGELMLALCDGHFP